MVYPDGSDIIARRLKCVAWRATVEMSKTVSQLIFLVRSTKDYFIPMHVEVNFIHFVFYIDAFFTVYCSRNHIIKHDSHVCQL